MMRVFYFLLANTVIANVVNSTVWFAITFFTYLQTESVLATSIIAGLYLVFTSLTGFWFGSLVDSYKKKNVMLISSVVSLVSYIVCFIYYQLVDASVFTYISSPGLWIFVFLIMTGVIAGNLRSIALPTIVTIMIPEPNRDKANGLVGTATGVAFLVVSVFSGILVGLSGMFLVLLLAMILTLIALAHLWTIPIPEHEIVATTVENSESEMDMKQLGSIDIPGTFRVVKKVPGLMSLILFATFNNFLGGVFMSLMDPYGLSLVSVEIWGLLWGLLSTAFIVGGLVIAKTGLGKNPLRTLFLANTAIWVICSVFTLQPSIILLISGMYMYLLLVPYIEAAEHTVIQKVVDPKRQGRVFGFAQSIEQAASPLTAFFIGPIAELIFIPLMTNGAGAELIGEWYGTGPDRGMALIFSLTGIIGLIVTLLAMRSRFYSLLTKHYRVNPSGLAT